MTRNLFSFSSIILTALVVFTAPALAVSLKNHAILDGSTITVADIFSGVEEGKGSRVLGPAPLPGKDMVLNARTLMRVAIALDLPWRPATSGEQITLSRAATIVKQDTVLDALKVELQAHDVRGNFEIIPDRVMDNIVLPA